LTRAAGALESQRFAAPPRAKSLLRRRLCAAIPTRRTGLSPARPVSRDDSFFRRGTACRARWSICKKRNRAVRSRAHQFRVRDL